MDFLHPSLKSSSELCRLLAGAKYFELDGIWSGDAYENHPHGLYRKGVLFCDHHSINDYCEIKIAEEPTAKLILGHQDSYSSGNPWPRPSVGKFVTVWVNGEWLLRGPWQERASHILYSLEHEIAEARELQHKQKQLEAKIKAQSIEEQIRKLTEAYKEL